ncbi:MAG: pyruvate kinase [Acidobacteria bacterium]|nr:pyruvate kinase [Acidobacteriota bacterium]
MTMRRTKIVCTLGPATASLEKIRELVRAGMDVARLNFSHGTHEDHARVARLVRQAANEQGKTVALLQDLCGPKIRSGKFKTRKGVELKSGASVLLTSDNIVGSSQRFEISCEGLARDVRKGDRILIDDGLIELRVLGSKKSDVQAEVITGGLLRERKGVNLPGVKLRVESLTPKDEADLQAGIAIGVDYVALSFVRRAADVQRLRSLLKRAKANIAVVAKLEKPEAVEHLDAILAVSDGVMVARGDLGVELPPEKVPLVQKKIIQAAAAARVPVITATQMLESMTVHPRPTRAEASDVANAILDGTDAVMLSGETASGAYPIEALEMMVRIAVQADQSRQDTWSMRRQHRLEDIAETICETVVHTAQMLNVRALVAFSRSGSTARLISKYRPPRPVYAFCDDEAVARRAALYWGVTPFIMPLTLDSESTLIEATQVLLHKRLVAPGDILAVVAGNPAKPGQTDRMRLVRVSA